MGSTNLQKSSSAEQSWHVKQHPSGSKDSKVFKILFYVFVLTQRRYPHERPYINLVFPTLRHYKLMLQSWSKRLVISSFLIKNRTGLRQILQSHVAYGTAKVA